jgi:hypothetical protein
VIRPRDVNSSKLSEIVFQQSRKYAILQGIVIRDYIADIYGYHGSGMSSSDKRDHSAVISTDHSKHRLSPLVVTEGEN